MNIDLSINPSYFCNFSCDFCYLTPAQLRDKTRIGVDQLTAKLADVSSTFDIRRVDLYGGEICALPVDYVSDLLLAIRTMTGCRPNVVTNLSKLPSYDVTQVVLSVSYDFSHREKHEQVLRNMHRMRSPIHVLILATPGVIADDVDNMIATLNDIPSVITVEIKPYSTNQANNHQLPYVEFERFIQRWITSPVPKRFSFINEIRVNEAIRGMVNSFSNDHLYITPTGDYAVLDFDLNDREYFRSIATLDDYITWSAKERNQVFANSYCGKCEYLGRCLSEHLRDVKDMSQSCNGFKGLLDWYATLET